MLSIDRFDFYGVCRSPERLPDCVRGFQADYTQLGSLDFLADLAPDYVIAVFKPQSFSVEGYRLGFAAAAENLRRGLGNHVPEGLLMVSSTRVFAEQRGRWVDEDSPLSSSDQQALAIIDAEQRLGELENCSIVRFGGLYGNPASPRLERIAKGEIVPSWPIRYTNRLHRADSLGFLAYLIELRSSGQTLEPCYIAVDDEPAPQHTVEEWLADELGVLTSEVAKPGTGGHRRCSNALLKRSGYTLMYPNFRAGYQAVLAARSSLAV